MWSLDCSAQGCFWAACYLATDAAVRRTQYEVVRGLGRMLRDDELVFDGDYAEFEAALSRVVQRPPRRGRPW
jgi:hypothetical protein